MKIILFILLALSFNLFAGDLVNWKTYSKNIDKPVFLLLVENEDSSYNDKVEN